MAEPLVISDRLVIPADELSWTAARTGGPGGQNVNKVASKVDLRFDLAHTQALSAEHAQRLRVLVRNRLDSEGQLVVISSRTRDQLQNLMDARQKLRALVLLALHPPKPRKPTKKTKGSQRRRLAGKAKHSDKKRARSERGFEQ